MPTDIRYTNENGKTLTGTVVMYIIQVVWLVGTDYYQIHLPVA